MKSGIVKFIGKEHWRGFLGIGEPPLTDAGGDEDESRESPPPVEPLIRRKAGRVQVPFINDSNRLSYKYTIMPPSPPSMKRTNGRCWWEMMKTSTKFPSPSKWQQYPRRSSECDYLKRPMHPLLLKLLKGMVQSASPSLGPNEVSAREIIEVVRTSREPRLSASRASARAPIPSRCASPSKWSSGSMP